MKQIHQEWFEKWQREVQEDYTRLYEVASSSDPQQAGHGAETTWVKLLKDWLPSGYSVGTRKYIITEEGEDLFETDIVIFNPGYPERLRSEERILAGGVAAAFSVKLSLTADGIRDAVDRAAKLRRNMKPRTGSHRGEVKGPFLVGLLAHSHKWKQPGSDARKNLAVNLSKFDHEISMHPRESLDLVCVADLASVSLIKSSYMDPEVASIYNQYGIDTSSGVVTQGLAMTDENSELVPLASFIASLIGKLAQSDLTLRDFANNLRLTGALGAGSGHLRVFPARDVYSEHYMERLAYRLPEYDDWVGHLL